MYCWEMSSVCIIQRYIHQHVVDHWRFSQNVQRVCISDSLLALALQFRVSHSRSCTTSVLCCINYIKPVTWFPPFAIFFTHSQSYGNPANKTTEEMCLFLQCVLFLQFWGMRLFLFLELEFSLDLQRLIVRGTQTVQECNHVSLCHSNFTHKTLLYMFTC